MNFIFEGELGLWSLFLTGFLSSTLLPGGSEIHLMAALKSGSLPEWQLLAVATVGNSLGGLTNYVMGSWLPTNRQLTGKKGALALAWAKKYGVLSLLLSWLPVIGDPLCLVAGWLRLNPWWACLSIFVGKALRYLALAAMI